MRTFLPGQRLRFDYANHRGKVETRDVIFKSLDYGHNDWYIAKQWFIRCHDLMRNAPRSFALEKIDADQIEILPTITHYGLFRANVPRSPMIKEAGFFAEQGGLTEPWGQAWEPIDGCMTIGEARRKIAEKYAVQLSPIYSDEK